MARRRVTSADVARAAGVSRSTVSYVFNPQSGAKISAATRARVQAAAEKLGYRPSASARALRRGSSEVVLGLLPPIPLSFSLGRFLHRIGQELGRHGLAFVVHAVVPDHDGLAALRRAIDPAAVVTLGDLDEMLPVSRHFDVPLIPLAVRETDGAFDMSAPNLAVARAQVEQLYEHGHRRLLYAFPDDPDMQSFAALRHEGVRRACSDLGLPEPDTITVPAAPEGARRAIAGWREKRTGHTAICAFSDGTAVPILAACRDLAIAVPDEIAVIGADNSAFGIYTRPALTSVTLSLDPLALNVADVVAARLGLTDPPDHTGIVIDVVARDSV